jgi:hypothetical protein
MLSRCLCPADDEGLIFNRGQIVSVSHRSQTGTGTHPASYSVGTVDSFALDKAAGA